MTVITRPTHRADQMVTIPRSLIEEANAILDPRSAARDDHVRSACYAGVPRGLGWSRCRSRIDGPAYIPHTPAASRPASLRYLCAASHRILPLWRRPSAGPTRSGALSRRLMATTR